MNKAAFKICLVLRTLFLLISIFFGDNYPLFAQQRPIAYFPFNNSAEDYSGFSNHGTQHGAVASVADRFGNPCSALSFDGVSGYIEVPTSSSLESPKNTLTITVWYKLTNINSDNYWLTVMCKGTGNQELYSNPQYRLQVQQNKFIQTNTCSQIIPSISSTISMSTGFTLCDVNLDRHFFEPGVWHFYAITYDGATVKSFMDGKKVFENSYAQNLEPNKSPLYIGMDEPGAIEYFNGAMDELKIFNVSLSEKEIAEIYADTNANANADDFDISATSDIIAFTGSKGCATKVAFNAPTFISPCANVIAKQIEGPASGSLFPFGESRIKYQLSTSSNYNQYLTYYIIVKDNIPPIIKMPNDVRLMINEGDSGIYYNYKDPTATDNCKLKTLGKTFGNSSGDFFRLGKNEIVYTATDESGNTISANFYVEVIAKKSTPKLITQNTGPVPSIQSQVIHDTVKILKTDTVRIFKTDTIQILKTDTVNVQPLPVRIVSTFSSFLDTLSVKEYKPNNLLFLIDVSASMNEKDKIKMAKLCIQSLVKKLRNIDKLTLVTFSDSTSTVWGTAFLDDRPALVSLVENIIVKGGTKGGEAIEDAYKLFQNHFTPDANNEIFMFTDGLIDDITKKQKKQIKSSAENLKRRIKFNIFAFGNGNKSLNEMVEITNLGAGNFISINTKQDALETLITLIKINSKY